MTMQWKQTCGQCHQEEKGSYKRINGVTSHDSKGSGVFFGIWCWQRTNIPNKNSETYRTMVFICYKSLHLLVRMIPHKCTGLHHLSISTRHQNTLKSKERCSFHRPSVCFRPSDVLKTCKNRKWPQIGVEFHVVKFKPDRYWQRRRQRRWQWWIRRRQRHHHANIHSH